MPVDWTEIVHLMSWLSEHSDIRVSVSEVMKGTGVVMSCTAISGLVLGPPGLAIGGGIGGVLATWLCWGKYKPAHEIIDSMSMEEKQRLYQRIIFILKGLDYTDINDLRSLIQNDPDKKKELVNAIAEHLQQELRTQVQIKD